MVEFNIPTPKTVQGQGQSKRYVTPVIQFERPKAKDYDKSEILEFKLRSNPNDEHSTTYSLSIPYFKSGTPEELLVLIDSIQKVFVGQHATTGPQRYALVKWVLKGEALTVFEQAAAEAGNETLENLNLVLRSLKTHFFPCKALSTQKRYMRRFLRKPREMNIREFMARLTEINGYLKQFPPEEANQELPADELMDIAEYAVPATWQRQMMVQGFDAIVHTPGDFVEFCERLEHIENMEKPKAMKSQADQKGGKKGGLSRAKSSAGGNNPKENGNRKRMFSRTGKWCEYHLTDSHDTSECKVVLAQIKRMRLVQDANKVNPNYTGNPRNYTGNSKKHTSPQKGGNNKESFQTEIKEVVTNTLKDLLQKQQCGDCEQFNTEIEKLNLDNFRDLSVSDDEESA